MELGSQLTFFFFDIYFLALIFFTLLSADFVVFLWLRNLCRALLMLRDVATQETRNGTH